MKRKKAAPSPTRIDLVALFPGNLLRARERNYLSQAQLAARAAIAPAYISLLELGERTPSLEMIGRLAGAMGMDPRMFFRSSP